MTFGWCSATCVLDGSRTAALGTPLVCAFKVTCRYWGALTFVSPPLTILSTLILGIGCESISDAVTQKDEGAEPCFTFKRCCWARAIASRTLARKDSKATCLAFQGCWEASICFTNGVIFGAAFTGKGEQ